MPSNEESLARFEELEEILGEDNLPPHEADKEVKKRRLEYDYLKTLLDGKGLLDDD